MKTITLAALGLFLALCLYAQPATAQLDRTWVSGAVGTDANPCSRIAPCATFQRAYSQTNAGGEINCMDPGHLTTGLLLIEKSITIDCAGTLGALPSSTIGGAAVEVDGNNVIVRLRNLTLQGFGTLSYGIRVFNAHSVYVENCAIFGFRGPGPGTGIGIWVGPGALNGATRLFVTNSEINNNGAPASGGGILAQPVASSARVVIENSRVQGNTYGIFADGEATTGSVSMEVRDSVVANNAVDGISSFTVAGKGVASTLVERSFSVQNGNTGIAATGPGAFVILSQSAVVSNVNGIAGVSGGTILSYQDNKVAGNINDGVANGVVVPQ
jgi:hypothetical protein